MSKNAKLYVALVLNAAIIISEALGFWEARSLGWAQFCYYTQISNLLAGIVSIILVLSLLRKIRDGIPVPAWLTFLKYTTTIMLTQTFLILLTVLSPTMGGMKLLMLGPIVRYFHTLCPLLAMISFLCVDPQETSMAKRHTALAMVPTLLYGAVAIILNVLRVWHGPYPFLYVYEQPVWLTAVWVVVILGAAFLIALLLRVVNCRLNREYVYR